MKKTLCLLLLVLLLIPFALYAQSAMKGLHGDFLETRSGLHSGNQFRTTIYNDGTFGSITNPPDIAGEWPINSGHIYLADGNPFVGSEIIDTDGAVKHIISENMSCNIQYSRGDQGPNGDWWTFLGLSGFASPDTDKVAMSKWPWAWPPIWPDKSDDAIDPGWAGKWNGYFGKNVFNADEESYFVSDDYNNKEFKFYPDSANLDRRGLGIRMYVRGFQWSNALVEDALFGLFDLENIGTRSHDKMVFAYKIGNNMGDLMTGGSDVGDDCGAYNKDADVAYLYDFDDLGSGGWTPVGYFGAAFLESPGNPYDGIDNDGDADNGSGKTVTEDLFAPKTLRANEDIILIDYKTFERTIQKMSYDTLEVKYQDLVYKYYPGMVMEEIANNLVDDNLNGLIDENNGSTFGEPPNAITKYLFTGAKYIDYFTNEGKDNPLIEERRDDGIDNDGDWDALTDDVGADGVPYTNDAGEKDGKPTNGEPHFDRTDIDESDMIGLSSFTLYLWPDIPHYEDEKVWAATVPGYLDDILQNNNIELLYGSGYFPMKPGQTERFSMGIIAGLTADDFVENERWVAKAYNENYNFSKSPNVPTVTAVPGDNKVTLYWDTFAEESVDPVLGKDFEGYNIYRSTDPGWNDMTPVTDGQGSVTFRKPLAQFDLDNEYSGFDGAPLKGIRFWLGNNTGIVHSYVDTTARNGQKYFYAVTSFDHGAPDAGIAPSECAKFISIATSGAIDKGSNVVIVRPEAPSAGYVAPSLKNITPLAGTAATGTISYEIVDPRLVKADHRYRIQFEDTTATVDTRIYPVTKNMSLIDVTDLDITKWVTLIDKSTAIMPQDLLPMTDGFILKLQNDTLLTIDTKQTKWNRDNIYGYVFRPTKQSLSNGIGNAADYVITIGEVGVDSSMYFELSPTRKLAAVATNFTILNKTTNKYIDYAFWQRDGGADGRLTAFTDRSLSDLVVLLEKDKNDSLIMTWELSFDVATKDSLHENPKAGDYLTIVTKKPFLSNDVYEFTTEAQHIDAAKVSLENIKVVPNPYVTANSFEPLNPYSNGRGPRELHFIHLPAKCTIRIFNIRGQLINTIEHNTPEILDGTEIWDMMSKDNLEISYGVYILYVDAGTLGQKITKFAVIK